MDNLACEWVCMCVCVCVCVRVWVSVWCKCDYLMVFLSMDG